MNSKVNNLIRNIRSIENFGSLLTLAHLQRERDLVILNAFMKGKWWFKYYPYDRASCPGKSSIDEVLVNRLSYFSYMEKRYSLKKRSFE